MKKTKGFTLIEVLVVVLIIGILTSIALPQYQKAVAKARTLKLLPLIRALDSAEQVYYATYRKYTEKFEDLDISLPGGGSMNAEGTDIDYKDFVCWTYGEKSVSCMSKDSVGPRIEKYFYVDYFLCWHMGQKAKKDLCDSIEGSSPYTTNASSF